jgi:hypothetical protein
MPTRIVIDQQAIEAFCRRWGLPNSISSARRYATTSGPTATLMSWRRSPMIADRHSSRCSKWKQSWSSYSDGRSISWRDVRLNEATTTYDANTYSRTVSRYMWRDQAYLLDMLTAARDARDFAAGLTRDGY